MEVIREHYLNLLRAGRDKYDTVKVLTGMRRSGKSTLLKQFARTLPQDDNIIFLDLDFINEEMTWKQLSDKIRGGLIEGKKHYVFIDEIQDVKGWERVVAELVARGDCDVYITGSSSKMLSSELATKISGRYVEIEIMPFSFSEYLEFYPGDREERFSDFLRFGSLPITEPSRGEVFCNKQLEDVFNTVIVKDVLRHIKGDDVNQLIAIARFLFSNTGNETNIDNISKTLGISSITVKKYVSEMLSAHLFHYSEKYDIVGMKLFQTNGKYYATDIGVRRVALRNQHNPDISKPLENIVYNELRRRGYEIHIGSIKSKEIDFVATKSGRVRYYQVTQTMAAEGTKEREHAPLLTVRDNYPKTILTLDRFGLGSYDGIEVMNVIDWLLAPDS